MSTTPQALVLTGYGLNCDMETAHAFTLAGAQAIPIHVNELIKDEGQERLLNAHILAIIGGFSWADDHGAGVLLATRLKFNLGDALQEFLKMGKLIIGICNGFQVLVNMGFLPAIDGNYNRRSTALTWNNCGNFRDQWVTVTAPPSVSLFTSGIAHMDLPIRHGEGKFYAEADVIAALGQNGQVALRYALPDGTPAGGVYPHNPNGSLDDIAGVSDPSGQILGLMPHPEAFLYAANHPDWPQQRTIAQRKGELVPQAGDGLKFFENAVNHVRTSLM